MANETVLALKDFARDALKARQEIRRAKQTLKELATENQTIMTMSQVVGPATACVLWATVGNPQGAQPVARYTASDHSRMLSASR
jgi:uridine phosphorylase